jgi:N6-adenosine-specific RNA methylase IME4
MFEELSPPYATIVADPPWKVLQPPDDFRTKRGHSPLPYDTMSIAEISEMPVESLAADYAHLYLWTINKYIPDAYRIVEAWGFTPRMLLTWCKKPMGQGPGREYASITEFILMAKRGTGPRLPIARVDRNWWEWKRGVHSAKPSAFMDIVETVSPGPYCELFARSSRLGWDGWGDGYEHAT